MTTNSNLQKKKKKKNFTKLPESLPTLSYITQVHNQSKPDALMWLYKLANYLSKTDVFSKSGTIVYCCNNHLIIF